MQYIFANWKMYLNATESLALATTLAPTTLSSDVECAVFPSMLSFCDVEKTFRGSSVVTGVQDVFWVSKGAYTGAVSAQMAKDAGAKYALIGHSERRHIFGEKDTDLSKKIQACDEVGLVPVLCIGETKEDLDSDKRQYRLKRQLQESLEGKNFALPLMVAYEPVWAISGGDGSRACLPADAEDVIGWIKQELKNFSAESIPVLYGGSVTEVNAKEYLNMPSIDGLLIGSASTRVESFTSILEILS